MCRNWPVCDAFIAWELSYHELVRSGSVWITAKPANTRAATLASATLAAAALAAAPAPTAASTLAASALAASALALAAAALALAAAAHVSASTWLRSLHSNMADPWPPCRCRRASREQWRLLFA
jgi:hypothetical protein